MAPPNLKNNQKDIASDTGSALSTGASPSYDGESESSSYSTASSRTLDFTGSSNSSGTIPSDASYRFTTGSCSSPSRRSRRDSLYSPRSPGSLRRRRNTSDSHSRSSRRSGSSAGSNASRKSILKKNGKRSTPRKRSISRPAKKSPKKKSAVRPLGQFAMIKNPAIKNQVRGFLSDYSLSPEFQAFSITVDGIPFVAVSLLSANPDLLDRFTPKPPTPMKKHTPGVNSPRKRLHPHPSASSSSSKHVHFTDEESSPKKTKKSPSDEEIRELGETVSDAMIETDRQYDGLWKDRTHSAEKH